MRKQTSRPTALHILLAEDSLVSQKLVIGLLQAEGHAVTVAQNGREAIEAVGTSSFDLILMDVDMPEVDGLSATRAIRKAEQHSGIHTPIVAITSNDNHDECIRAGMDGFLSKHRLEEALGWTLQKFRPTTAA